MSLLEALSDNSLRREPQPLAATVSLLKSMVQWVVLMMQSDLRLAASPENLPIEEIEDDGERNRQNA